MKLVLRFCNKVRAELGLPEATKLEKGTRTMACFCPVAKTIAAGSGFTVVVYDQLEITNKHKFLLVSRQVPKSVFKFIRDFDKGLHPEYDLDA